MTDTAAAMARVYGESNGDNGRPLSKGRSDAMVTASRAARKRAYGFNLPADFSDEMSAEDLSIALIGQGFADNTTSHGIPHVYKARSGGKRIFWLLISLASLGALLYHMYELISTYSKNGVVTSISVNNTIRQLEFPAVTICNNNMLRTSAVMTSSPFSDLISNAQSRSDKSTAKMELIDTLAFEYALLDEDLKYHLGHQFEDMIVEASFSTMDVIEDFVHEFNPHLGNCFTFNHHTSNQTFTMSRAGPNYGLQVLLNLQQFEYVPFLTEASGIRVLVHDPQLAPFPEDDGVNAAPNTLTRIAIRRNEYQRLDGRYGDCHTDDESDKPETIYQYEGYQYSKSACELDCIQRQIIKGCGCFDSQILYNVTFFPSANEDTQPCDETDTDQGPCMDNVWIDFSNASLQCSSCENRCSEVLYDVTPSSTVWPAPTYMVDLINDLATDYPQIRQDLGSHYDLSDGLEAPIKENLLRLEVFYDRISKTEVKESPAVTDFQFISDIGGSLGLWVGWSMLTIFEYGELIVDLIVLACVRRASNKTKRKTHPQRIKVQQSNFIDR